MVLHPNDDDPAVAAPEPHLPIPSPQPKFFIDIELKRYRFQNCCPPWPFNNNSKDTDVAMLSSRPEWRFSNNSSYNISNPPPDQSVSSSALQQRKMRHFCSSLIWTEPSTSNNLDLKGHVMVKVRTTPGDIIKLENNIRIIPEEEAVCSFCFHMLFPVNNDHNNNNNDNVLETKCLCPFTLAHEHCATESSGKKGNTKCNVCDQDTNYIPVTLSTPPLTSEEKPNKGSSSSTLKKWSCFRTD